MSLIEHYYKRIVRPNIFFQTANNAEDAHNWGIDRLKKFQESIALRQLAKFFLVYENPILRTSAFGLNFAHPLGLAAGFDKCCEIYSKAIPLLGWSFCEVGSITYRPREGNPERNKVRMLRSEEHQALWNWMGLNNRGSEFSKRRMQLRLEADGKSPIPVGLNIACDQEFFSEEAVKGLSVTLSELWQYVNYVTVNPSCPNVALGNGWMNANNLLVLFVALQKANKSTASLFGRNPLPVGLKISPDCSDEEIADIVTVARKAGLNFLVATGTTKSRVKIPDWNLPVDRGAISGKPLTDIAERILSDLRKELKGEIALIGVGGIHDGHSLYRRILKGADLCEAYTAWIFEGPDFVKRALKQLVEFLKVDGFARVSDAVGKAIK